MTNASENGKPTISQQVGLFGLAILVLAGFGCQRLGVSVAQYLPERKAKPKQAASSEETSDESASNEDAGSSGNENMGDGAVGGMMGDDMDAGLENDGAGLTGEGSDPLLATGGESDPSVDGGGNVGPGGGPLGEYNSGLPEPPTEAVGEPETGAPTGSEPPVDSGPDQAFAGNTGPGSTNNKRPPRKGRKPTPSKPKVKPEYHLIANAAVPVFVEGQRMRFSVEYSLQRGEPGRSAQYGLVIEANAGGRYEQGPLVLGEEGTINTPPVSQFRPNSGPFKAYLVQQAGGRVVPISKKVQFKRQR